MRKRIDALEKNDSFGESMAPRRDIELELETVGIEIEEGDIQSIGPYLTYRGEHLAIVYILNSWSPSSDLQNNDPTKKTPRFHVTWCETLEKMKKKKKFNRYVLSRFKSNLFRVEAFERDPDVVRIRGERHMLEDIRLFPCQNCLDAMQYRGFRLDQPKPQRLQQVDDFAVSQFLEENDGILTVMKHLPTTLAEDARGGGYTEDFPEVSRKLREQEGWTCSECNIDMQDKKQGLHVHHINGVKSDNRKSNLKVLCALCHQKYHKNMHINSDIERYILLHRPK